MEYLLDIVVFACKALVVAAAAAAVLACAAAAARRGAPEDAGGRGGRVELTDLRRSMERRRRRLRRMLRRSHPERALRGPRPRRTLRQRLQRFGASERGRQRLERRRERRRGHLERLQQAQAGGAFCPENLYVMDFTGSPAGREVRKLRAMVDALLDVATPRDEVIVNLTSPGGLVNTYGLCASQLVRIREHGIRLVCTVDSVAASGGYLMACVAHRIVAAPFAYVGSIGVIAAMPNFHRLLERNDIDYEQITAGRYKRTLTVFGENTEEGRAKFREELAAIHERFKEQVLRYRPGLDAERVCTGEHWLASDALALGLVDEIATSDEYVARRAGDTFNCVMKLEYRQNKKRSLLGRIKKLVKLEAPMGRMPRELLKKLRHDDGEDFMHIR